jgi:tRNA dimethylallyltransferase
LYKIDPTEANKHHSNSIRYIVRALEIYHQSGKTKTESFTAHPPKWPLLMLGLWREKDDTNRRINKRIHEMFDE